MEHRERTIGHKVTKNEERVSSQQQTNIRADTQTSDTNTYQILPMRLWTESFNGFGLSKKFRNAIRTHTD